MDADSAGAERGGAYHRGPQVSRRSVRHHQVAPASGGSGAAPSCRRELERGNLTTCLSVPQYKSRFFLNTNTRRTLYFLPK